MIYIGWHRPPKLYKPCKHCRPSDLERYGFSVMIGGKYFTGSGKGCCPIKVTVTKVTATDIYYTDSSGEEHQKDYHEFMTSSWRDKTP